MSSARDNIRTVADGGGSTDEGEELGLQGLARALGVILKNELPIPSNSQIAASSPTTSQTAKNDVLIYLIESYETQCEHFNFINYWARRRLLN